MKIYRILGKRGRVTIPFLLRQKVGFAPNDVLSFTDQDGRSILIRRGRRGHARLRPDDAAGVPGQPAGGRAVRRPGTPVRAVGGTPGAEKRRQPMNMKIIKNRRKHK